MLLLLMLIFFSLSVGVEALSVKVEVKVDSTSKVAAATLAALSLAAAFSKKNLTVRSIFLLSMASLRKKLSSSMVKGVLLTLRLSRSRSKAENTLAVPDSSSPIDEIIEIMDSISKSLSF